MNFWNSSGIASYQLIIGLNVWILGLLWRRGTKRQRPFFTLYMAVCLACNLVFFPLLAVSMESYSRAYWIASPLILASEIMAVAELWNRPKWGISPAVVTFIIQLDLVIRRSDAAVDIERYVLIGIAMACVSLAYKNLLALGFLLTSFGVAMTMQIPWLLNAVDSRYLPTYAFLVANAVWLVSTIRQEVTAESQQQ